MMKFHNNSTAHRGVIVSDARRTHKENVM